MSVVVCVRQFVEGGVRHLRHQCEKLVFGVFADPDDPQSTHGFRIKTPGAPKATHPSLNCRRADAELFGCLGHRKTVTFNGFNNTNSQLDWQRLGHATSSPLQITSDQSVQESRAINLTGSRSN